LTFGKGHLTIRVMRVRRWRTVPLAVLIAVIAVLSFPVGALASIGVGVQDNPVRLAKVAVPGKSYALPPVAVINTGTQTETITVRVERIGHGRGLPVPPSWVHASSVRLDSHEIARIPLQLAVPGNARTGAYLSDVVVVAATSVVTGRANLGVAAATKLEFRVGRDPGPGPAIPAWTWWAAGGLVLLAAAAYSVRQSGLRIRIERGPTARSAVDPQGGYRA
jgi:hypothetical protein